MKERIAKGIFWFVSIGVVVSGLIFSGTFFFMNRQMFLQALILPILGIALNPFVLDKVGRRFSVKINYFKILAFSSTLLGATVALVVVTFVFLTVYSTNTNLVVQDFESILKIVVYFIYIAILFLNQNANKNNKYVIFGMIYLICVLLSFASQSINFVIMNFLNAITSSNLDLEAYELFVNDILIPIREAILTYIIFDTIMGNENRKQDKINDMNVKKDREDRIIKDNAMNKYQLHSRWHKKKKKYTPYNFDEKREYKIYNNIGERYRKEFTRNKRKINEKYPDFEKYAEWEKYFKEKFLLNDYNTCNFFHYLNDKLRIYQIFGECFKSLVIPIYVAILTIILTIYSTVPTHVEIKDLIVTLLGGTIVIIIVGMFYLYQYGKNINFYEDCLRIIENSKTSHQN